MTPSQVVGDLQRLGMKRSRLESPGECCLNKSTLLGGFKVFLIFTPTLPGEMIRFDEHIFQMV